MGFWQWLFGSPKRTRSKRGPLPARARGTALPVSFVLARGRDLLDGQAITIAMAVRPDQDAAVIAGALGIADAALEPTWISDHHAVAMDHHARVLRLFRAGRPNREAQLQSNMFQALGHFFDVDGSRIDFVKRVEVHGCPEDCGASRRMEGQTYTLHRVLSKPVIPAARCTRDKEGPDRLICGCMYLATMEE